MDALKTTWKSSAQSILPLAVLAEGWQIIFFHQQEFSKVELITPLPSAPFPTCTGGSAELMSLEAPWKIQKNTLLLCSHASQLRLQ